MSTSDASVSGDAKKRHPWRRSGIVLAILLAIILVVVGVTSLTPWPSAMLIRSVFEQGGAATVTEMTPYVPSDDLHVEQAIAYTEGGDPATTMDVFSAADEGEKLPAVVWVHGGAWISGSSANVDPYLRILAAKGYTTIGVNYSLGPEQTYPTAVTQLNEALAYISAHADELRVDASRIVLAGDSAGAQLASQLATMTTNPDYADLLGIAPALSADQLVGVILNCGVYDMSNMADLRGIAGWGFKVALWAYTGSKDWSEKAAGATMSTVDFVTEDFPPTYISGGNGDGLTWLQSIPMSQRLAELDVPVTTLFWPESHEPQLPHEYQFHLDLADAQDALTQTVDWLDATTAG